MTPIQQLMLGVGKSKKTYVDELFSTYLYRGTATSNATNNATTKTITNGIDLAGEGGMVWIKGRTTSHGHEIFDTQRGILKDIRTDRSNAEETLASSLTAFNSNGFGIGDRLSVNENDDDHVSWTFRKAKGFFDVVTWTGNDTAGRTISHSLGGVPGCIIVKCTTHSDSWQVWHRSTGGNEYTLELDNNNARMTATDMWNSTAPTASNFTLGNSDKVNGSGRSYVAYIFAHDNSSFGVSGNASVVKCSTYTGNGGVDGPEIDLGWEPQWILFKRTDATSYWTVVDVMRKMETGGNTARLYPHITDQEEADNGWAEVRNDGFKITTTAFNMNQSGGSYIFIAIRRPDGITGKPVEDGTKVFAMDQQGNGSSTIPAFTSGFPVDMRIAKQPAATSDWYVVDRIRGQKHLRTHSTAGEDSTSWGRLDSNEGEGVSWDSSYHAWMWKRHAGFDVVGFAGNGNNTNGANSHKHSLGKTPEMIWVKNRSAGASWRVYHKGLNGGTNPEQYSMLLNTTDIEESTTNFGNTAPTSTLFYVGDPGNASTNGNAQNYVAYLFASVDGVSKVGYYDGSNSTITINLGFQPRFLMIKRANASSGTHTSWFVIDTTRGWASGSEQWLRFDEDDNGGNHDFGAPTSTGISLTGNDTNYNGSGGKFIYYAHA